MTRIAVGVAFTFALAMLTAADGRAQTTIQAQNGQCLGLDPGDGRSVVLTSCYLGLQVSHTDGGPILVDRGNGRFACIDGYQGDDEPLEVVVCDGTAEQNWGYDQIAGGWYNGGTRLCMEAGRKVISAPCTQARRQQFVFGSGGAASVAGVAAGSSQSASFGSGVTQPAPVVPQVAAEPASGAGFISENGGALIGHDGSTAEGSTLIGHDGSTLMSDAGTALVGNNGNSVLPTGAGGMVSQSTDGHGGIVAAGAGNAVPTYGVQSVSEAPAASGEGGRIVVGGLCLNQSGNAQTGYFLTIADCNSASRFFWSDGNIVNPATGLCIDGIEGAAKVGREEDQSVRPPVKFYNCDTSGEQNWQMHEFNGQNFFIRNERFGLCMDVDGGVVAPGRSVLLWKCYEPYRPVNQIFTITG